MNDGLFIITLVAAVAVLVLLIAKLASFWRAFADDARYICHEMDCANSYKEYRRWRGELRCHYLCLIPFVNEKNVMRVYRFFFHRGDHSKNQERKDSIVPLLMPSILGICICFVCICGMTWAWYSASVETPAQKMTAAYYEVTVVSVRDDADANVAPSADGSYNLIEGTSYTVTLKASGSVEKCGGYCLIECGDTKYYTQTFRPEESITIIFIPETTGTYTFTGVWGSLPAGTVSFLGDTDPVAEPLINGLTPDNTVAPAPNEPSASEIDDKTSTSNEPTEDQTPVSDAYTVQPGDTLSAIADKCNTTAAKLAAYNGIDDANSIYVGQIIKIPPEDWKMPVADSTSPEQTETDQPSEPIEPAKDIPDTSEASQTNQEDIPKEQENTDFSDDSVTVPTPTEGTENSL